MVQLVCLQCKKIFNARSSPSREGRTKFCSKKCFYESRQEIPAYNTLDLTGQRFGRLVVIKRADKESTEKKKKAYWECQCDCEKTTIAETSNLRGGQTKSCGCLKKERTKKSNTKHGFFGKPEYRAWASMMTRCFNTKNKGFPDYGGRGITVCERWRKFENFYADLGQRPGKGYSLERLRNNGHYEPGNVIWATPKQQSRNKRNNIILTHNGQSNILADWAEELNIGDGAIRARLRRGWTIEQILNSPLGTRVVDKKSNNIKLTDELVRMIRQSPKDCAALARELGLSQACVYNAKHRITWKHVL